MHIALIIKTGTSDTGVGRYTSELERALQAQGHQISIVNPVGPFPRWLAHWTRRLLRWDLDAFFQNYPIWVRYPKADLYHITSQNLATLMLFHRPPGKVIITVHDIIPWVTRNNPELRSCRHFVGELFDRISVWGIQRADHIIADSEFSRNSLFTELSYSKHSITRIMLGVG
jgi:glycosyltransferase involved in cell wall biosynthesis